MKEFKNLKIVIVSHVFTTGPTQELVEYLKAKVNTLIFIGHPLFHSQRESSFCEEYERGQKKTHGKSFYILLPEILKFAKHVIYTLYCIFKSKKKYDLYVGVDPLNAYAGLMLRRVGLVKKAIMYTVDYIPKRFNNRVLNSIYHYMDSYCVKECNWVWNLSPKMTEIREKKGLAKKFSKKQLIVPMGTDLEVKPLPFEKINRYEIGFMGHLRKGHGLELLIESFADVVREMPKAKMVIIGKGGLENYLKHRCKVLQISSDVNFLGYVEDHKEALKRLSLCVVGLAPYEDNENTFTRYADPGKPKAYLSVGLPIIITKVPAISKKIKKTECGIVIDYDKAQLTKSIIDILTNDDLTKRLRTNAIKLRSSFSWERIFKDVLKKTLKI